MFSMYDKKIIDKMPVLLKKGFSIREVGRKLGVSDTCVRYNTNSELKKLERIYARNRSRSAKAVNKRLLNKYGLNLDEWKAIRSKQDGKCAICSAVLSDKPSRNTHVDHDHDTGEVRGLLCGKCNAGLGYFMNDIKSLRQAIKYLT